MNTENHFMTETAPGQHTPAFWGRLSLLKEEEFIYKRKPVIDQPLKRVDHVEIGLVKQTEGTFLVKKKFRLVKEGGHFIELPDIIFDPNYFLQEIKNSPALQAGEYVFSSLKEKEILAYAQKGGFDLTFDLSQIYSICLGYVNGTYQTLNQESVNYFLPLNSKKGVMLARINTYGDEFILNVEEPSSNFLWVHGIVLGRYQALQDPTKV